MTLLEDAKNHYKHGGYIKPKFYTGGEDPYAENVGVNSLYTVPVADINVNEPTFVGNNPSLANKNVSILNSSMPYKSEFNMTSLNPEQFYTTVKGFVPSKDNRDEFTDAGLSSGQITGKARELINKGVNAVKGAASGTNWNRIGEAASVMAPNVIGSAANAYLASKINYDRVSPTYQDANLLDPNRALQQVGSTYSGANAALQSNTQGGQYLANRLASAASEASKRAEIAQQYANANAGILNQVGAANAQSQMQANMTNAQIQQQELGDRLTGYGAAIQSLQQGASNYLGAWQEQRRTEQLIPFLGGPNFKAYLDAGYNPASLMEATLYDNTYRNKNEFKR